MKKILTFILSITMILSFTTKTVNADGTGTQASPWEIGASGNESGVTAYLDDGVLYINGSGQMKSQVVQSWPWYSVKDTITTAVIANGITNIGKSVLRECTNLSAVSIPDSVTEIDSTAFYGDTSLTSVVLSNALTEIGSGAFNGSGLTSIVIPTTVTTMHSEAFKNCSSLSSVKVLSTTPPTIEDSTFTNADPLQIYVPQESVDTYKAAANWSELAGRIQAIPLTIEDMLNKAANDFPVSNDLSNVPANAWVKSDGTKMFINNGYSPISLVVSGAGSSFSILAELTLESQNKYKYSNGLSGNIHFTLENNKLISIEIDNSMYANANGIYTAPPTVGDIIPSDFPTTPTSAWSNGNSSIYLIDKTVKLDGAITAFNLSSVITKDTNGNYFIYNSGLNATITFIMDGNEFTSIQVSDLPSPYESYNGTYASPILVSNILGTISGGFPTTMLSGWVNENGRKIYVNGNILTVSYNVPLDSSLQKDGDNYKYSNGSQECTFVMTSGKLTSIIVSGAVFLTDFNGEYSPYKFTKASISIQAGYTGDVEFVTNGKYIDQVQTPVTVTVDSTVLNGSEFDVTSNSTHIKLKGSYVRTLAVGTHTLTVSMDGYDDITTEFTITNATPSPSSDPSYRYIVPNTGVK